MKLLRFCATLGVVALLCAIMYQVGVKNTPPTIIQVESIPLVPETKVAARNFKTTMSKVFSIGREVGHPETLQAILLKETGGGQSEMIGNKASPIGKRSYGVMQVQLVAARSILQRYPTVLKRYFPNRTYGSLFDEEVIALLLTNDEANIRIAAHHFNLYLQLCESDWDCAVAAYNVGIGGAANIPNHAEFQYVVDIKAKVENDVKRFNQQYGLQLTPRT